MEVTKQMLDTEIQSQLELLANAESGSDEYKSLVEGISKLIDRRTEMEKIELEFEEKRLAREQDKELKQENSKFNKVTTVVGIVIPVAIFVGETIRIVWGTNKTLKFEETGTVTTQAGRSFINKLFSKK